MLLRRSSHDVLTLTNLVGVSTWAVHHLLGTPPVYGTEAGDAVPPLTRDHAKGASLSLLDLPAELARRDFDDLQICHFHLPTRDTAYLAELRAAIDASGVTLNALLVDAGDITHLESGERDAQWIARWLPVAANLGAHEVRVIAGRNVGAGAMDRSVAAMTRLAKTAASEGIALTTENWFPLLDTPAAVRELLERCEGNVRLLLDFGNWSATADSSKHERLAQIAPFASSCHAKATVGEGDSFDEDDYAACLNLPYPEGFRGPYLLVNNDFRDDVWEGLGRLRDYIRFSPLPVPASSE